MAELLAPYRDRILDPVFSLSASKKLLQKNLPEGMPTALANACRAVAHQVIDLLQLPLEDAAPRQSAGRPAVRAANSPQPLAVAA